MCLLHVFSNGLHVCPLVIPQQNNHLSPFLSFLQWALNPDFRHYIIANLLEILIHVTLWVGDTLSNTVWILLKNDSIFHSILHTKIQFKQLFNSKQALVIQFRGYFNSIARDPLILANKVSNIDIKGGFFLSKIEDIDWINNSLIHFTIIFN